MGAKVPKKHAGRRSLAHEPRRVVFERKGSEEVDRSKPEHLFREKAKEVISETLAAFVFVRENERCAREFSLMERVVRVEEELRALKEIQIAQFQGSEKRFEALQREISGLPSCNGSLAWVLGFWQGSWGRCTIWAEW